MINIANIDNILYIQENNNYHIVVEFSVLPVETFGTEYEAKEFIDGYLEGRVNTAANRKGEMFRNFVEIDRMDGVKYKKVREVLVNEKSYTLV